ncbi:MAG: hypothetical protein K2W93_09805 [Burkholderiaceae bacterium]|nr:hypothetical protein [Burkholderiaceae bacterium]
MKLETLLTLAALGAAAALLWPKAKPATSNAAQGLSGPFFGGSAGSLWSPDVLTYLKPQAPQLGVLF